MALNTPVARPSAPVGLAAYLARRVAGYFAELAFGRRERTIRAQGISARVPGSPSGARVGCFLGHRPALRVATQRSFGGAPAASQSESSSARIRTLRPSRIREGPNLPAAIKLQWCRTEISCRSADSGTVSRSSSCMVIDSIGTIAYRRCTSCFGTESFRRNDSGAMRAVVRLCDDGNAEELCDGK